MRGPLDSVSEFQQNRATKSSRLVVLAGRKEAVLSMDSVLEREDGPLPNRSSDVSNPIVVVESREAVDPEGENPDGEVGDASAESNLAPKLSILPSVCEERLFTGDGVRGV